MDTLRYFARTYFHQDWDLEASTPGEAVANFCRDETAEKVAALKAELEHLMSADPDEQELEKLWLHRSGAMWSPAFDGRTFRGWFTEIIDIVQRHTDGKAP